jgi:HD superfamily phosphohydrolase YqeK
LHVASRLLFEDPASLTATGCRTTLKRDANAVDRAGFVADKITWNQDGDPPNLQGIVVASERSLEAEAFCHLDYLLNRSMDLKAVLPGAWAACEQMQTSQGHWER